MPSKPGHVVADPYLIKAGDIVWLHSKHLTSTRGVGARTWPHYGVCLGYFNPATYAVPSVIVTGTVFQFACISSVTKSNPFDPSKQVQLDHASPNNGLVGPSVACVDFSPQVQVTVEDDLHVLDGVRRLTDPVIWRVPASPTLQAIHSLFTDYWTKVAASARPQD